MEIHPGLPMVKACALQDSRDEVVDLNTQIKNRIRLEREAINLSQPFRIGAANDRPSHERINVAIRKHDEPCPQSWNDFVLQAVGEIRGVKKAHGDATQRMTLLGLLEPLPGQSGPGHPGVQYSVTAIFQPLLQEANVRGATHPVGPLQDNEPAL